MVSGKAREVRSRPGTQGAAKVPWQGHRGVLASGDACGEVAERSGVGDEVGRNCCQGQITDTNASLSSWVVKEASGCGMEVLVF